MKMIATGAAVAGAMAVAGAAALAAVWMRERRSHTVFPASQADALLNPLRRWIQRPAAFVQACGIDPGERVLEVGAGPGYFTVDAARAAGERGRVVCLDVQPAMLARLSDRIASSGGVNALPVAGDAMRLPFVDRAFDRAFLVAVLGEVPNAAAALREIRRVLRPGGTAVFYETINDPDYVREGVLRELCWDAGLAFVGRRRKPLGYIGQFRRSR